MGSNTSTNTNANDIYTEQQYVETVEDKYDELLRQNELLRQENEKNKQDNEKFKQQNKLLEKENEKNKQDSELLKLGNYNLKRDNDNLREDIYNLRLKNVTIKADKQIILHELDELKLQIQELQQKLPKTNLLPKVSEKEDYRQFMLDCVIQNYYNGLFPNYQDYQEFVNQQTKLIETIICSDEYIVSCKHNCLVTNKGKIFQKAQTRNSNNSFPREPYSCGYTNLELIIESEMVLNLIVEACEDAIGTCGYDMRFHKCTLGLTCRGKWSNGYSN